MEFNYTELIFIPFVYNYLFVSFLFAVIFQNVEFPLALDSKNDKIKPLVFIPLLSTIPFLQWYYISFRGWYYPSAVFIFDFILGLLIFTLSSRISFLNFKKRKILVLLLCAIISYYLIKSIWVDTAFIMTLP